MNTLDAHTFHLQRQQVLSQYAANALLPEIAWTTIFAKTKFTAAQLLALDTLYQQAVPLALQVFNELKFDVFAPSAYQPQGLGLFDKLAAQEQRLIQLLVQETQHLPHDVRHQIWSMLLRGGAVLVFKAWLAKVKTSADALDLSQFDELSDLLFVKTRPLELAKHLNVEHDADLDHIFLLYQNDLLLDRFNSLETAALFVELGVYDATFLSLRDDRIAQYLIERNLVTVEEIDELQYALNPLFCDGLNSKQDCLA